MRTFLLFCLLMAAVPALAEPIEVEVTATGSSRQDAIANGLVEAIQQVTGVAVAADQVMQTAVASAAVSNDGTDSRSVSVAETAQSAIRRTANGIVRTFRVLDTEADEPAHVVLHLTVTVEKFEAKGLGNDNRRRIAVASFAGPAGRVRDLLRDRLISYLTQARRFAVLDRANTQVYQQEMATIAGQAPVTEGVRQGQVLGADYVVVGTIRQASITRSDRTIELTGERIVSASSAIEVDWQVLEIATRQVKWSGSVHLGGGGDGLDSLVDGTAARIGEEITQAVYPMRLIDASDPNALIINQGGSTVHPGQRFRAMVLGKQLIDPYTKEPLGQTERQVALVEVQRVDNKVSYARLVSGQLPDGDAELVLRPAPPAAAPRRAPHTEAAPVIKLPGER